MTCNGFTQSPLIMLHYAEIVVRDCVIGLQPKRFAIMPF